MPEPAQPRAVPWPRWLPRRPVSGWALGWGVAAMFLVGTGASHGWSDGGMARGLAGGLLGWLVGGLGTVAGMEPGGRLPVPRLAAAAAGWAVLFAAAVGSGWWLAEWCERSTVFGMHSAGFLGLAVGAGIGGAVGGLAVAAVRPGGAGWSRALVRAPVVVGLWGVAFALGFHLALIAGIVLGEFVKRALEPLVGWYPGLVLGWGLGAALGGALAGGLGSIALRRPPAGDGAEEDGRAVAS